VDELQRQQQELSRNRGALRHELYQAENELADRERHGDLGGEAEGDLQALRERLRGGLHALLAGPAGEALAQQAVALALAAVDGHRSAILAREQGAQAARLEQLRRRVARLRSKLDESEALLARAHAAARQVEIVVGPDRDGATGPIDDPQRRLLLEELFRMNVELRRLTGTPFVPLHRADSPPPLEVEAHS
jgi:hypothetical protein